MSLRHPVETACQKSDYVSFPFRPHVTVAIILFCGLPAFVLNTKQRQSIIFCTGLFFYRKFYEYILYLMQLNKDLLFLHSRDVLFLHRKSKVFQKIVSGDVWTLLVLKI